MYVGIISSGSQNHSLTRNHLGTRSYHHVRIHPVLNQRVSSMAHSGNSAFFNSDIRFDNTQQRIQDRGIGYNQIQTVGVQSERRLPHSIPDDFAPSEFDLISISSILCNQIFFNLNEELGIPKANLIPQGGTVHFRILSST